MEYTRWVEEILELNYGILNIVVLLCNWVKTNYIRRSATFTRDEYGFTFVHFTSLILVFRLIFCFPITCRMSFVFDWSKGKGVERSFTKRPHGRWVIEGVQINLIDLYLFGIDNVDEYVGLQAPNSISEVVQITIIIRGVTFTLLELGVNVTTRKGRTMI